MPQYAELVSCLGGDCLRHPDIEALWLEVAKERVGTNML